MYTRITGTRNGRDAIAYAEGSKTRKGHNGHETRNLLTGGVNLMPESVMPYADQMQKYWNKASSRNKTQARRIIASFSKKELDPDDPNSAYIALEIGMAFIKKMFPNRQAAIYIQADGKGGYLHMHIIVNNVSMDNYRGFTDDEKWYKRIEENFDKVAKDYITLDPGQKKRREKVTQHERNLREQNESGAGKYIWKDDLKSRIDAAMEAAESREHFVKLLADDGVSVTFCDGTGNRNASKKYGDYILYELKDTSKFPEGTKIPANLKSKSHKLGSDYGFEKLNHQIFINAPLETPLDDILDSITIKKDDDDSQKNAEISARRAAHASAMEDILDKYLIPKSRPKLSKDRQHADDIVSKAREQLPEVMPAYTAAATSVTSEQEQEEATETVTTEPTAEQEERNEERKKQIQKEIQRQRKRERDAELRRKNQKWLDKFLADAERREQEQEKEDDYYSRKFG